MIHSGRYLAVLLLVLHMSPALALGVKDAHDPRLPRPVTVECVNMRLYEALDQLSSRAGVRVRCGKDSDDWQVRDIPVVVCAVDAPLGEILQAIAETTHMALSTETNGETTIYRIWNDPKRADEKEEHYKAVHEAVIAQASWDWDALSKLKDLPVDVDALNIRQWRKDLLKDPEKRSISVLYAILGDAVKQRVLAGEKCRFDVNDAPINLREALIGVFRAEYAKSSKQAADGEPDGEMSDEDLKRCYIDLLLDEEKQSLDTRVCVAGEEKHNLEALIGEVLDDLSIPGWSQRPVLPKPADSSLKLQQAIEADISTPVFDKKITLTIPKDNYGLTYAVILASLSKATGHSIVSEDFDNHTDWRLVANIWDGFRQSDLQVRKILSINGKKWRCDTENKILIGQDRRWPEFHKSLVPKAMVDFLCRKLANEGVELDDLTPLLALNPDQFAEWIYKTETLSRSLAYRVPGLLQNDPLWRMYHSLAPENKAQAKSHEGLQLTQIFKPELLVETLQKQSKFIRTDYGPELADEYANLADTDTVSSLVMRVKSEGSTASHTYIVELEARKNGEKILVEGKPTTEFPIHAAKVDKSESNAYTTIKTSSQIEKPDQTNKEPKK